jgi:hypothetical protein
MVGRQPGEPSFGVQPLDNGRLRLLLSDGNTGQVEVEFGIEQVTGLAATALHCARVATELGGLSSVARNQPLGDVSGSRPDEVGLATGPEPSMITLVARYGLGRLGLPMTTAEARRLGIALLQATEAS